MIKRNGRRVPFDRDKLLRSVQIALRKRPVDPERVERMVSGIVRRLENMGENDIPSETIGRLVMEALKGLDDVAYDIASQASAAWEAAVCWDDAYSIKRLAEVRAV